MNNIQGWDQKYRATEDEIAYRKEELTRDFISGTLHEVLRNSEKHMSVLEIGCGTGQHAIALLRARPSWHVTAIDTSKNAIEETIALAHSVGIVKINALVADATALPFHTATFDIVFGDHVLGHIPDVNLAVSESIRVLKKGGVAIFNGGNALRVDGWPLYHILTKKTYYARSFFPSELVKLFIAKGGVFLRSYGTIVFLRRGWDLLITNKKNQSTIVDSTKQVTSLHQSVKQSLKNLLEQMLPSWLKVEYGIVVKKV